MRVWPAGGTIVIEEFRSEIPAGAKVWSAAGWLDPGRIARMAG
jgi:hypothetical protein